MHEWAKQADIYESIRTDGLWNKTLQIGAIIAQDHPFAAVRVREILLWSESEAYRNIKQNMENTAASGCKCPNCNKDIDPEWGFCRYCGTKL